MGGELTLMPAPSLYDPSPRLLDRPSDDQSVPLEFETAARAWTYAVAFPRLAAREPSPPAGPFIVRATLDVQHGRLGAGVQKGSGPDFLDEVIVGLGRNVIADLLVSDAVAAGDLIIRNASSQGSSGGCIRSVETFAVALDLMADREPGLSCPTPIPRWSRYYGTLFDTPLEKLRAQAFDGLSEPAIVRWCDGLSFRVSLNDQVSRALFVSGTYEPNTLGLLRRFLRPGDVCLDVGANAGLFTIVAAHCVSPTGRVISFEPSTREYQRLCDAVQLNDARPVTPLQCAAGAAAGHLELRVAAEPYSGLNTLGHRFPYDGVDVSRLERVEVQTLDECVRQQGLSKVDLVKIDVEGAEAAVLAGAARILRQLRPRLIIEVFSRSLALSGASIADVEQHLRDANYGTFAIDDETADLVPLENLTGIDEQNIVALPKERM